MTVLNLALWFVGLSFVSIVLMFLDKRAAQNGNWRVAERTLLLWAFAGGAVGAKLAQNRFRHKTRKQPFATLLNLALVCNVVLAIALLIPSVRETAIDLLYQLIG